MVGLVLVSHSRALAVAVRELARQMAVPELRIAIAAGVGDERAELGTDAVEISDAIQSVFTADGVLVLMDLGSAILSAEMALDLLPDVMRQRVRLCPAPLVEGAISAAIQAGMGNTLDAVYTEASAALQPKTEQLSNRSDDFSRHSSSPMRAERAPLSIDVTLRNPHGLHARPAAKFVQTAARFDANITVHKGDGAPVSANSLNKLATLGVSQGDTITINAQGPQAQQALDALRSLVENHFGETAPNIAADAVAPSRSLTQSLNADITAIPVSPGIAIGPLQRYISLRVSTTHSVITPLDAMSEWTRLAIALDHTQERIRAQQTQVRATAGADQAAIFGAHQLILHDEELLGRVHHLICANPPQSAQAAWQIAINELADQYKALPDTYMQQRAADVLDVGAQVLSALRGEDSLQPSPTEPAIFVSDDFTPAQVAQLKTELVLGIISTQGSSTSHAAILARALGIPAIAGIGKALADISSGTLIAFAGSTGQLWINPSPTTTATLTRQRDEWHTQQQKLRAASHALTHTRDGQRVEVAVNLSGLTDARVAIDNGAEAVGVLRTEFLYLNRNDPPSEDEQTSTLQEIASLMQGRPVIVRTLDVGGDKPIPYLPLPHENNPYLGMRAIRLSLLQQDIFITQVRAILRAAAAHPLRILLPMVTVVEELQQARALIVQAHQALTTQGVQHSWPVQLGVMVETPAAALLAHQFAAQVDFLSIGTNDLTQYTLAAERGNPQVAHLADALHPSILLLIQQVVTAARTHNIWAGVCGEAASDALAIPILVGLGVDELSVNVAAVPQVKAIVRALEMPAVRALAQSSLTAATAAEVRQLSHSFSVSQ